MNCRQALMNGLSKHARRLAACQVVMMAVWIGPAGRPRVLLAQISQPGQAPTYTPTSHTPHPAVCRIIVPERDGMSFGSGTLVALKGDNALVITNWHVVRDASDVIKVRFPDGFESGARVLRSDRDWDLAALLIWKPNAQPVPIAPSAPRPGDPLTIAGYGFGDFRSATGRCTQYVSPGVDLPFEMVEVSVEARQGDSGGPIFNQNGELAGVLFGASDGTTSGSYAGRVGQFLAAISPDLGASESMVVAQATPPLVLPIQPAPITTAPAIQAGVASSQTAIPTAAPLSSTAQSSAAPVDRQSPSWSANNASTMNRTVFHEDVSPGPALQFDWKKIAGETPAEWAKSVFAAIGVLAVLARLLRRSE